MIPNLPPRTLISTYSLPSYGSLFRLSAEPYLDQLVVTVVRSRWKGNKAIRMNDFKQVAVCLALHQQQRLTRPILTEGRDNWRCPAGSCGLRPRDSYRSCKVCRNTYDTGSGDKAQHFQVLIFLAQSVYIQRRSIPSSEVVKLQSIESPCFRNRCATPQSDQVAGL